MKRGTKIPWTYERILQKYLRRGVHPLSAKAQADEWLMYRLARERREAKHGQVS